MSPSFVLSSVAALALASVPASAANPYHHRRHAVMRTAPASAEAPAQPFMFYPRNVEGGVSGNLPFNNQIRKHTDPLNANGGR